MSIPYVVHRHQPIGGTNLLMFIGAGLKVTPRGENDHGIPLIPSGQPPNVHPYWNPFVQKNEIEKIIQELLKACAIHPRASP